MLYSHDPLLCHRKQKRTMNVQGVDSINGGP